MSQHKDLPFDVQAFANQFKHGDEKTNLIIGADDLQIEIERRDCLSIEEAIGVESVLLRMQKEGQILPTQLGLEYSLIILQSRHDPNWTMEAVKAMGSYSREPIKALYEFVIEEQNSGTPYAEIGKDIGPKPAASALGKL